MITIPDEFTDLLDRPIVAGLATVRPDGQPESSPMWFLWDGTHLQFTHTTYRKKLANLESNPFISLLIIDPADPHRYLQLRGRIESITPDPTGAFFTTLAKRYGKSVTTPRDAPARVVISAAVVGASYATNA